MSVGIGMPAPTRIGITNLPAARAAPISAAIHCEVILPVPTSTEFGLNTAIRPSAAATASASARFHSTPGRR